MEWSKCSNRGIFVPGKKGHAMTNYSKYIIVHGGMGDDSKFTNEFYVYGLVKGIWQNAEVSGTMKNLCNHKMVACYNYPSHQDIYGVLKNYPTNPDASFDKFIKFEGLYIFGGRFEPGVVNNDVIILNTNTRPWKVIEPEILGRKPMGRWGHTMHYDRENNRILVYGGRNNTLFPSTGNFRL